MVGTVVIAEDVRSVLGAGVQQAIRGSEDFRCTVCDSYGSTLRGDDVSVVAIRSNGGVVARFFHTRCTASRVIDIDVPVPDLFAGAQQNDVTTLAVIRPRLDGSRRAVLIVELRRGLSGVTEHGDVVSPWLSTLLESGWTLAAGVDDHPPRARGWRLDLDRTTGQGQIKRASAATGLFLEQLPELPAGWVDLAARQQEITVFATRGIGLETASATAAVDEPGPVQRTLRRAAEAGNLVAARVNVVSRASTPRQRPSARALAAGQVADALAKAIQERARPGQPATEGINARVDVIPLPGRPRLTEVIMGGFCVVVVDLATPPALKAEATRVLRQLSALGFRRFRSAEEGPLPKAPQGWNFVLWKSQIAVLVGEKKFLFEPLPPTGDWYEQAGATAHLGLGLLVGRLALPYGDNDPGSFQRSLLSAMESGQIVGCAMLGLLAQ